LGVYKVKEITKEEFVANAVQVEMQHYHFYILSHAIKVVNVVAAFRTIHGIINIYMV
jgi:hypothetical protein